MDVRIEPSWKQQLQEEFDKPYFEKLVTFVKDEYKRAHVLPLGHQIFHIFNSCPFEKVKVVILGQDPYPNPGQYYGVCFSVPDGVAMGSSRCIPAKLCSYCTCARNRFSSKYGLGNLHRRSYQETKWKTGEFDIYALGKLCERETIFDRYQQTSGTNHCSSLSPLCRIWFLRL